MMTTTRMTTTSSATEASHPAIRGPPGVPTCRAGIRCRTSSGTRLVHLLQVSRVAAAQTLTRGARTGTEIWRRGCRCQDAVCCQPGARPSA